MSISSKDIKKLWGMAAGRCSKLGCQEECIKFLNSDDPTVIGEMAHVIAKKPDGPRGKANGGDDTYENLILLCPTHHTEIDKSPEGTYTVEEILRWKELHEQNIANSFLSEKYETKQELAKVVKRILIQNYRIWKSCGPESDEAKRNPMSNFVEVWNFRKLDTIVPNNRRIINIINGNNDLFEMEDLDVSYHFIEHAEGFERNCYSRTEGVSLFPAGFEEVINNYANL
ncbi:hypothetical protein CRYPD_99 [uncultured Candidatus Thioglobus sp.]|nr:hypothetical protein CRYPD_99 [uncultured Candidatus Thioglobus sp.]